MLALKLAFLVLETVGPSLLTYLDACSDVKSFGIVALAAALPQSLVVTPTCPAPPGAIIQVESAKYEVFCNTALLGDNLGGFTIQADYAACVARCSDTPGCMGATYSAIDEHCEVKRSLSDSSVIPGTTSFKHTNTVSGAHSIIKRHQSVSCDFESYYITVYGKNYGIRCDQAGSSPDVLSRTVELDYAMCLQNCAEVDNCQAAQYNEVDQQCVLYTQVGGFKIEHGTNIFVHFVNEPGVFDPTFGGNE